MEDQTNGPATRAREEGALELAESKSMKPYMSLTIAMIQGRDVATALKEIASLPLEERYVWRIASALKWALVDFNPSSLRADIKSLPPADLAKVRQLVRNRAMQFRLFLAELYSVDEANRMLSESPSQDPEANLGSSRHMQKRPEMVFGPAIKALWAVPLG